MAEIDTAQPYAGPELPGLEEVCRALAQGQAVVVPNPSPMTYGIVATSPRAVNALKRRPPAQNVAVALHDTAEWRRIVPSLDVPADTVPRIVALLRQRLSVLVPLRDAASHPDWIGPAVRTGYLAIFNPRWAPTAQLWDRFPRLYGSSANLTDQSPAATVARAIDMFGAGVPVVDGDALHDGSVAHAASSMVRVAPDGGLSLHRHGAQDAASGLAPDAFVHHLASTRIGTRDRY